MARVPVDAPRDVVDDTTGEVLLRVVPIAAGSEAARLAAWVGKLFLARAALVDPTQRAHPGKYFSHGIARSFKEHSKLQYYGLLRGRVHVEDARWHSVLQTEITATLTKLMAEAERAFGPASSHTSVFCANLAQKREKPRSCRPW